MAQPRNRVTTARLIQLSAALLVLAIVVTCFVFVPRLLRAASVVYAFSHRDPPPMVRVYNHFFGYSLSYQDLQIAGAAGHIEARVYTPIGRRHPRSIVLVHGFAPDGNQSAPLNSFARALAHQGFRVVVPTLPAEQQIRIEASDIQVIEDTILWTAATGDDGMVSISGISFGGGLSIVAAQQPAIRERVRLVLSVSGYNDLPTIARFYTRQKLFSPNGTPYPAEVHPGTAMVFVRQYLGEMVPPSDLVTMKVFLEGLIQSRHYPLQEGDPVLAQLTPAQQQLFFDLQNVRTPEVQAKYEQVIQRHYATMEAVSPRSVLGSWDHSLYVLHGSNDIDIPPQEVAWMEVEVPKGSDSHFLVTPWMQHAAVGTAVSSFDRLRVGGFLASALAEASR